MNLEIVFSVTSIVAMVGWLILLASPFIPKWSDRISGFAIPIVLSLGYFAVLAFSPATDGGGFDSLEEVTTLFSFPAATLAAWVHFLAFDLFIGAWQCRTARSDGIRFPFVIPCLALTFLLGPLGLLTFLLLRYASKRVSFLKTR